MDLFATIKIEGIELEVEAWVSSPGHYAGHPSHPENSNAEIQIEKISVGEVDITEIFDFDKHEELLLERLEERI